MQAISHGQLRKPSPRGPILGGGGRALGPILRSLPPLVAAASLLCAAHLLDRRLGPALLGWEAAHPHPRGAVRPAGAERGAGDALDIPGAPAEAPHRFVRVTVTGYTSLPEQTDDTPFLTATLSPTRPGTLALSRDLLRTFSRGAPFDFGDRVLIPGMGIYVVEDTMHPRWARRADIWFEDNETALRWGLRQVYMARVDAEEPLLVAARWHPNPDL